MTTTLRLHDYQREGVNFLLRSGRGLLADEAGLGKSAQLITAAMAAGDGDTLVVAPAMVLDGGTWQDEIAKWAPGQAGRFTTVSYTSLTWRRDGAYELRPEYSRHWSSVIFDESHYIKSRSAVRSQAALEVAGLADHAWLATGTPIPNYAPELFTALQVIYPGEAKPGGEFGSYWRWAHKWFQIYSTRYSQYNVGGLLGCNATCALRPPDDPCEHYRDFAEENLGDHFLRRRRDDVLGELPPLTKVEIQTPMGSKQKTAYKAMKTNLVAESESGQLVVSWSHSAKHVRLDRLTTGLTLLDDNECAPSPFKPSTNDAKLARLAQDLEGRSRPTLVFAHYRATVEMCHAVAVDLGLKSAYIHGGISKGQRERLIRQFQQGKLDVLVGSLETLAEGLTLVAADMVIFVETSYKPSRNEQALRRIHRIGQTRPVTMLDYVTPNTIDSGKRELLKVKNDHQMATLTAAELIRLA